MKQTLGMMIAQLRKQKGMTQLELAEKMGVTDKAVSKWERAESLPDVLTLLNLAEQLGTDLNTLTGCAPEIPEPEPMPEPAPEPEPEPVPEPEPAVKTLARRYTADKTVIQKLSSILVWVVALFLYMVLDAFGVKNLWLLFVVAVPVNAIVLLSLRSAWKLYGWNRILISIIMWGFLLTIYLLLLVVGKVNVWKILPMGLLGQAAILLWFKMFRPVEEEAHE